MRIAALLGVLLLMSGCVSGWGCEGWKSIRPTKGDVKVISDPLADQILAHNEFGMKRGCWKK